MEKEIRSSQRPFPSGGKKKRTQGVSPSVKGEAVRKREWGVKMDL